MNVLLVNFSDACGQEKAQTREFGGHLTQRPRKLRFWSASGLRRRPTNAFQRVVPICFPRPSMDRFLFQKTNRKRDINPFSKPRRMGCPVHDDTVQRWVVLTLEQTPKPQGPAFLGPCQGTETGRYRDKAVARRHGDTLGTMSGCGISNIKGRLS